MTDSILIIDDNEDILEFLTQVFGNTYKLHLAISGEVAQEILDKEIVDLIISDIMMPGIDGFELCRLIKSNVEYCHIPIILLTSKNTYKAHIEGLEVGADLYIKKPFSPQLLRVQVANLLQNRLKIKAHFASAPFEDVRVVANSKIEEAFLKRLDEYVRKNIQDPYLDIDQLAEHMHMSRPTLYRKIKAISALSPKELIDVTRLKKATKLIAQNEFSFFEIAKMVGYSSQSLFNKNFLRYFKVTPQEYMNSLSKDTKDEEI
ncbi:DNA-binding response regulator [Pedobacter sp. ISL-68]|uniref:response regulator transcription factor n=1 Tax=unclassified Pedobacter TaxID=2628915 RepID=UPI001BE4F4AD|nr:MULTISPECIES: DNA-binding response regulator [unclassified Pedobacter]MBT2560916.1 DNA-binding response regulator [Pedobacter sp. ISL-64]MBT2590306.1 DNA-binding response regulator [Pedobacter sp. ISL-68]